MKFRTGVTYHGSVVIMLFLTTNISGSSQLNLAASNQAKQAKPSGSPQASAERSLQLIGTQISQAVLDKDVPTLLTYDRADLRGNDEVSLHNTKSDLYCYIFDSECITWGDGSWQSVYDKLSHAHPLEIKARLARLPSDHQLYGSLLFYDGSTISEKDLRSADFLCKEAPAKIASWKFRLEKGKWKAVTPLFDAETEGLCPQEPK